MNKKLEIARVESEMAQIDAGIKMQSLRILEAEDNIERLKESLKASDIAKQKLLIKLDQLRE